MIGQNLSLLQGQQVIDVTIAELAAILFEHKNHFFRIVWHSDQRRRLNTKGTQYENCDIRKLYVATVRNNFSFEKRVRRLMERRGHEVAGWQPQGRSWGFHVLGTPFVAHQNVYQDGIFRLYGHFLVPFRKGTNEKTYYHLPGETGYYVNGVKALDKAVRLLEHSRRQPTTPLDKARKDSHPVNARLDDIVAFKVGGRWYRLIPPNMNQMIQLAFAACHHGQQVAAQASVAV